MKRMIIKINEDLCTGCGDCITDCAEGALQIVGGKAKLIKKDYCDGLGACLKGCPTGALTLIEEEAPAFDEEAVKTHLAQKTLNQSQDHNHGHHHSSENSSGGCPGSRMIHHQENEKSANSELTQWPVQLHLVNPSSPFFNDRELVVLSTCAPTASTQIHSRFIRGRSIVVLCPKLDNTENYVQKLAAIFANTTIPKVLPVIMEVPCCKGLTHIVMEAMRLSKRTDLVIEEQIIGLDGTFKKR